MDAIQIIIFHWVITQPTDGLVVVSLPGPCYGSSPIDSLFAVWHLWWVSGEYHTKYSCLFGHPLWVTKFINYHYKLVWLNPILIINLEDYISYPFSFFFCCIIGSDRHVIVVFDCATSNPESFPVHFQWGQIANLSLIIITIIDTFSAATHTTSKYFWYIKYTKLWI